MVEITVSGGCKFEGAEAYIIKSLIVDDLDFVGVFDELVDGESGIVRLDNCIGDFGGGKNGKSLHNPVGVFLTDFCDEEGSHTGTGSSSEGVANLEALETVTAFCFFADDVEDRVDELGAFGVMAFGPVVSGSGLAEDEVVGAEELAERPGAHGVHCPRLQVHEDGARDVAPARRLVVVDVDPLQLEVRLPLVHTRRVDPVLV